MKINKLHHHKLLLLTSMICFGSSSVFAATELVRGPYVQMGTSNSMTIRWDTNSASASQVNFGTTEGALTQQIVESSTKTQHIITLSGLTPKTRYYYSVGTETETLAGGNNTSFFETSPITGSTTPIRIWVVGDPGRAGTDPTTLDQQKVLEGYQAFNNNSYTDFWLMLGDNAYVDGTLLEYQRAVFDQYPTLLSQSPLWPVMGNHDNRTAKVETQTGGYYDLFSMPTNGEAGGEPSGQEAYFSFDYGNIHVVVLNSSDNEHYKLSGPMDEWLENDLKNNNSEWVISVFHHSPYGKSGHDSDAEIELIKMRENFLPILEKHGVDLVMAGHNHFYTRSTLVANHYGYSNTYDESLHNIDTGNGQLETDGAYTKTAGSPYSGTVYITHGAGAGSGINSASLVSQQDIDNGKRHPTDFIKGGTGSLVIDIDGTRMDVNVIDIVGDVVDHFTIEHNDTNNNQLPVANANGNYNGTLNNPVNFSSVGTADSDGFVVRYFWDFGDGTTSSSANPSHIYTSLGDHKVTLLALDNDGGRAVDSVSTRILNQAAATLSDVCASEAETASSSKLNAYDPICIDSTSTSVTYTVASSKDFTNMAINTANGSGDLSLYVKQGGRPNTDGSDPQSINIGNGECIYFANPSPSSYTYIKVTGAQSGAALVVDVNVDGCRGDSAPIANQSPTANANGNYNAIINQNISFSSAGSNDIDGSIEAYLWQFGDGATSTLENPNYRYNTAGTYQVNLKVTDDQGATATSTSSAVIVANVVPTSQANGPYSAVANQTISFTSNGSTDTNGNIVSYYWDFADGVASDLANPQHSYDTAGEYTVTLTVTDNDGATASSSTSASISSETLINELTNGIAATGVSAAQGEFVFYTIELPLDTTDFDVSISGGVGDADIYTQLDTKPTKASYLCRPYKGGNVERCLESNPAAGLWYIGVMAYNDFSDVTLIASFTDNNTNQAPTADANGPYGAASGKSIQFSSAGSIDNDGNITTYLWDFGDGTSSNNANPVHSYENQGNYTTVLTVTDSEGATGTDTVIVEVTAAVNSSLPDVCDNQAAITGGRIYEGQVTCLGSASTIQLSFSKVNQHNSVAISTAHGTGDLSIVYSTGSRPNDTNVLGSSENTGNNECIYVTGGSNDYWGYLKITGLSEGAAIVLDYDSQGCR